MRLATLLNVAIGLSTATSWAAGGAGNAWHVPSGPEPGIASMRSPVRHAIAGTDIAVYNGNQFQGAGGNPGNQLQTGSAVIYRHLADATWTTVPMTFFAQSQNNKYFVATIPGAALAAGDVVEYYLRIAYSDHATTFVFGGDDGSQVTLDEATAQASAFAFAVDRPLAPSGPVVTHSGGVWEARVYTDTGHVALEGNNTVVNLSPSMVKIGGSWFPVGRVTSQSPIANGLALQQSLGRRTITANVTFPSEGVLRYEVVDWGGPAPEATEITGASDASEHFYGLGEKFNALDQSGKVVRVMTSDHAGDKGDNSYLVTPWFVSSRGYGVHLDASAESSFDLRASAPDRYTARLQFGKLAVNVVGGPTPREVLTRFTGTSGRAPLPPAWVFGPWISSDAWRDGGEIRYVVAKLLANKVPGSVFVFDSPWEVAYNDFAWNTTQFAAGGTYEGQHYDGFATLADMMSFLRSNGLYVVVWLTPFVDTRSNDEGVPGQNLGRASTYDFAAQQGYFVRQSPGGAPLVSTWWKGDGSPIDFTNPAARAWFQQQLKSLVDASGGVIAGFKTDDGESDYIPLTASYADGRTGVEMKNGYCVEYLKAAWTVLGSDGIVFARSGFTGTQAYPAIWAGDNEPNFGTNGLPGVVIAALSSAMSGYAIWGSDIGGYQDVNPSSAPEDLFMRWTQFGALSPIMQIHRQVGANKQYAWSYGQAAFDNYIAYAKLHVALFPYLYTLAKQASVDGTPLMRPLPLVDPSPEAAAIADEYLLGDDLLVAPIVAKQATSRQVYLPAGGWIDYWTNAFVAGGQTITWTDADPTHVPLFVRTGAIIPRISPETQTLADAAYVGNPAIATPDGALDFLVAPSGPGGPGGMSHVTLYDGTDVTVDGNTIELTSTPRDIRFTVYSTTHPDGVTRDGAALVEGQDWTYEAPFVRVHFTHAGGTTELVLAGIAGPGETPEPAGCGCRTTSPATGGILFAACAWIVFGIGNGRRRR